MAGPTRREMLGGLAVSTAAAGAYLILPGQPAQAAEGEMTPPQALEAAVSGAVLLVDIRRPDEWSKTQIGQGAVPIDMRRPDFAQAVLAARATADQPVALICARGVRSRRMTNLLREAGIGPIIDIPEGMLGSAAGPGWLKRGLPTQAWTKG